MKAKSIVLLMLALGCGLIAAIGITQVISAGGTDRGPSGEMGPVYVAMERLAEGEAIPPELLRLEQWPVESIPPGALSDLEEIAERRPRSPVYQGEPILDAKLLPLGEKGEQASDRIPPGFRVVAVKVDDVSGTASLIKPASRVDVLVHLQANASKKINRTVTQTILQDIKVFAVGGEFKLDAEDTGVKKTPTISLLVTPKQAAWVISASEMGEIRLVLRGKDDKTIEELDESTVEALLGLGSEGSKDRVGSSSRPGPRPSDLIESLRNLQPGGTPTERAEDPSKWQMKIIQGSDIVDVSVSANSNGLPIELDHGGTPASAHPTFDQTESTDNAGEQEERSGISDTKTAFGEIMENP